jgi:hypothetical protein
LLLEKFSPKISGPLSLQREFIFCARKNMKKNFNRAIVAVSLLTGASWAYAQGQLNWSDYQPAMGGTPGYSITIMSPNPPSPFVEQTGNTSWDLPAGSVNYGGGWIGGNSTAPGGGVGATPANFYGVDYQDNGEFEVGLYVATSPSALTAAINYGTPLATTNINGSGNSGLYGDIYAGSMVATDPNLAVGTQVFVGIAAWYSGTGASTYAAAVERGAPSGYVTSTSAVALGGSQQGPPQAPPTLAGIGLTSFSLTTDAGSPPLVVTQPATAITGSGATLNLAANPENIDEDGMTVYFEYGTNTSYGSSTSYYYTGGTSNLSVPVTGLLPGTLYHFQAVGFNGGGTAFGGDMTFTTSEVIATPPNLTGVQWLGQGILQFSFTNNTGASFTVLSTTNLSWPLSSWTVVGAPTNMGSGVFQFTTQPTTNDVTRFYSVRSP